MVFVVNLQSTPAFLSHFVGQHPHTPAKIIDFTAHHFIKLLHVHAYELADLSLEHILSQIFGAQVELENIEEWIQFAERLVFIRNVLFRPQLGNVGQVVGVGIRI